MKLRSRTLLFWFPPWGLLDTVGHWLRLPRFILGPICDHFDALICEAAETYGEGHDAPQKQ